MQTGKYCYKPNKQYQKQFPSLKIETLTTELIALQLFVKEQFFINKKQLLVNEDIKEPVELIAISSLQWEKDYLRNENG